MRQKLLELAEEIKSTGIVKILLNASNEEEVKVIWKKFVYENKELISRLKDLGDIFKQEKITNIFKENEKLENPMEIAVAIYVLGDENVNEVDIFENCDDLAEQMKEVDYPLAENVANFVYHSLIMKIMPRNFFMSNKKVESDEEDDE